MFVLRLKNHGDNLHAYFIYLEEDPLTGGQYMDCGKWKYAVKFKTKLQAETFRVDNYGDKFEVVSYDSVIN